MNENIEKLEKLSNLYEKGVINKKELKSMKNDILKNLDNVEIDKNKLNKKNVSLRTNSSPYIISINKMIFLQIITLGMYYLFWYYKQFNFFKEKEENQVQVVGKVLFYPVIAKKLFDKMHDVYIKQEQKISLSTNFVAGLAFALNALKWTNKNSFIDIVISFIVIIPPIIMQKRMNIYWKNKLKKDFAETKFTFLNWLILMAISIVVTAIIKRSYISIY